MSCCRFGTACSLCDRTGHEDVIPDSVCRDKGVRARLLSSSIGSFLPGGAVLRQVCPAHEADLPDPFSSAADRNSIFPRAARVLRARTDGGPVVGGVSQAMHPQGRDLCRCRGAVIALTEEEAEHRKLGRLVLRSMRRTVNPISILIERGLL